MTEPIASDGMRIVCAMFDPMKGGPVMRARGVYQVMQRNGHRPSIVLPNIPGTAFDYVVEGGVPCDRVAIRKPALPNRPSAFASYLAGLLPSIVRMRRYLLSQAPDVVHVNGAFDIVPALAAKMTNIPIVWHLNDTIFGRRLSRALGHIVRALATEVVAAARPVGLHYGIPEDRFTTIPAPVDTRRFTPRDPSYVPGRAVLLGLVGNWNWVKGQDHFVDVVDQLRKDGRDVRGKIVGSYVERQKGYWLPILEGIAQRGLSEVIDAPGFCDDVPAIVRGFDILLLTSRTEACPMCVLEAMACGVPVVSFDVGGVLDMVGHGDRRAGIVVPAGDVGAMVSAVCELLDQPRTYRMLARNGPSRARSEFSLEACVARHEAVYRKATKVR